MQFKKLRIVRRIEFGNIVDNSFILKVAHTWKADSLDSVTFVPEL